MEQNKELIKNIFCIFTYLLLLVIGQALLMRETFSQIKLGKYDF